MHNSYQEIADNNILVQNDHKNKQRNTLNDLRDSKQLQRDTKVDERDSNRPQKQLQKDVCTQMTSNDTATVFAVFLSLLVLDPWFHSLSVFPGFTFPPKKHPDPSLLSISPLVLDKSSPSYSVVFGV